MARPITIAIVTPPNCRRRFQPRPPIPVRCIRSSLKCPSAVFSTISVMPTLSCSHIVLSTLEDYFGSASPFDKLDIIGAPDFAEGAMENVGAVAFLDRLLFVDPK